MGTAHASHETPGQPGGGGSSSAAWEAGPSIRTVDAAASTRMSGGCPNSGLRAKQGRCAYGLLVPKCNWQALHFPSSG